MAVFRCKSCGGDLDVASGASVVECEYCGNQQTVPRVTDENIQALFNRANLLRLKGEFDKAEKLFEKILEADETEAEAYWGVILCKFGIEYVEDPASFKRIPTCHRTSYDSIVADEYYKNAIKYADAVQRPVYEAEARAIDEIQKGILAVSNREKPYDVFICYKETDAEGKRTQDSVIANEIYYQLKNEGFKVFYAAITLEEKLGSEYEPIIFAALNSAKVMLAVGTRPEYFSAVWVKNEWSRFLKMMKKDRTKLLIPCYRDMDAYELPEEFAHLQAQDMSKIGFINDLVRGIKKVVKKDTQKAQPQPAMQASAAPVVNPTAASLLKRMFVFLGDEKWEDADEYADRILDLDPENATAYLGKFMAEFKFSRKEELLSARCDVEMLYGSVDKSYEHALEYSEKNDKEMHAFLLQMNDQATCRFREEELNKCKNRIDAAANEHDYLSIAKKLKEDLDNYYVESVEPEQCAELHALIEFCENKAKEIVEARELARQRALDSRYQTALKAEGSDNIDELELALDTLRELGTWRDAPQKVKQFEEKIKIVKENQEKDLIYFAAQKEMAAAQYQSAIKQFESIRDWKDAEEQIAICEQKIIEKKKKDKKIRIIFGAIAGAVGVLIVFLSIWFGAVVPKLNYEEALALIESGEQLEAYKLLKENPQYEDSANKIKQIENALDTLAFDYAKQGKYQAAVNLLDQYGYSGKYKSACEKAIQNNYIPLINAGITDVVIQNGVTNIPSSAFENCHTLTSVTMPDSVTSIGWGAFSGCSSLASVTIPDSVTSIGWDAFYGCSSLTSIVIPNNVTSIGYFAFSGCSSLASVTIPDSVTSIGWDAFYGCSSLTSIVIPNNVTSIGNSAFAGCSSLTSITIPDSVTSIGFSAFAGCSSLESITLPFVGDTKVGQSNTHFGYVFGASSPACNDDYVPESLKTVIISGGTVIGNSAFYDCRHITSIVLPKTLTNVYNNAFDGCSSLTSITIPDSVTSIGYSAFEGCSSLASITIPDSVTSIGYYAFEGCSSLASIVLPKTLTNVYYYAFNGCNALSTVYYEGTANDWNLLTISSYNSNLTDATRFYYSETQPTTTGNYWHYVDGVPTAW